MILLDYLDRARIRVYSQLMLEFARVLDNYVDPDVDHLRFQVATMAADLDKFHRAQFKLDREQEKAKT